MYITYNQGFQTQTVTFSHNTTTMILVYLNIWSAEIARIAVKQTKNNVVPSELPF